MLFQEKHLLKTCYPSTSTEDELLEKSSTEEDSSVGSRCEIALDRIQSEILQRNTEKIKNIALEAMRYGNGFLL